MIKKNIIYHTSACVPMSLRELELVPDCERRIEYIFYAVNISKDFDELTETLKKVIVFDLAECDRGDDFITYKVATPWGDTNYLKIIVDKGDEPFVEA